MELVIKLVSHCLGLTCVYLCAVHKTFLVAKGHEQLISGIMILLDRVHDTDVHRSSYHGEHKVAI